jgi:Flp pilus assembly protein TadD
VQAWVDEAQRHFQKRKPELAVPLLEQALAADPNHETAKKILGDHLTREARAALEKEKYPEAIRAARRATELCPKDPDAWFTLGYSLYEAKDRAGAQAALTQYIALCPNCQWTHYARQTLASLR